MLFLAGLTGCEQLPESMKYPTTLMLQCFHEGQNPDNYKFLLGCSTDISLESPLDMYIFGYALLHVPIQWSVTLETPLDTLTSSIAAYSPTDDKLLLGGIKELKVIVAEEVNLLSQIEKLPDCLLHSVTKLNIDVRIKKPYKRQLFYGTYEEN